MRNKGWVVIALWLSAPGFTEGVAGASAGDARPYAAPSASMQEPATPEVDRDREAGDVEQDRQDQEQEKRDREQEARDREQEKRDREQEARDREQERLDRQSELYENGREALDEDRYERAEAKFDQLAQLNGPQTDAALYWKAYAENRLGKKDTALATIAEFKRRFPQSRWQRDLGALEIEVRQSSGQAVHPEAQKDDDLRMLAIRGLMNSDPERAMPLLGKVLENGSASPKEKSQALFVLAQSGSPQAREILGKIARGQSNPELQSKAIQYLAMFGGTESRKVLAEAYASTSDPAIKRSILRAYMIGGDRERLFEAAKNEKDDEVKREAIRQLGLVHAQSELQQLYRTDNSPAVRRELLQAFFLAGDAPKLLEAAQSEKDSELKKTAVSKLSIMHSKEATDYLMEILQKN